MPTKAVRAAGSGDGCAPELLPRGAQARHRAYGIAPGQSDAERHVPRGVAPGHAGLTAGLAPASRLFIAGPARNDSGTRSPIESGWRSPLWPVGNKSLVMTEAGDGPASSALGFRRLSALDLAAHLSVFLHFLTANSLASSWWLFSTSPILLLHGLSYTCRRSWWARFELGSSFYAMMAVVEMRAGCGKYYRIAFFRALVGVGNRRRFSSTRRSRMRS